MLTVLLSVLFACAPQVSLSSISLSGAKTEFAYGEDFTTDGLSIVATYSDDNQKEINLDDCEIDASAYDKTVAGEYVITVSYQGKTASYTVTVAPARVTSIALSGAKTEFAWGEEFSSEDLVVTKTLADGTTAVANSSEYTVGGVSYNKNKAGEYTIVVVMKNSIVMASYTVRVGEPAITEIVTEKLLLLGAKTLIKANSKFMPYIKTIAK